MEVMTKLVLFLFLLTVGKSPEARREFAKIQGEWVVVRAETGGQQPPKEALPEKVLFQSSGASAKQPANSLAFSGRLNPSQTPRRIEISTVSFMREPLPDQNTPKGRNARPSKPLPPIKLAAKSLAIYQVTGETMKLLIKPMTNPKAKPPRNFVTTREGNELLLELRRKTK